MMSMDTPKRKIYTIQKTIFRSSLRPVLLFVFLVSLVACKEQVQEDDSLVFVTRNSPTTYYETIYGPSGFEYDLVKAYSEYADKKLKIITADSLSNIFGLLSNGTAHIAAAGLTATSERSRLFHFSPSYMKVNQYILYRYGTYRPRSIEKLQGKNLQLLHGSSHEVTLNELSSDYPDLKWTFSDSPNVLDLLTSLRQGKTDYIIVDSNDYDLYKSTFPGIGVAFSIKRNDHLVWMLGPQQDNHLLASINHFFTHIENNGELELLVERHYGHISHMGRNDSRTFVKRLENRLPGVEPMLKKIAFEEAVDWRLLAAISYQESHWNPNAKSPTGVRGLMMLTKITAKEMGVTNRVDPEQSLRGGARYFLKIRNRLPESILEPDRTWMALAAYNVGFGHLEDARVITQRQGGNPNLWLDVMERLPLLRKREYYSKTRHGYARGNEPVTYVQRIRNYYAQLSWRERNEEFMMALASTSDN